MYLNPGDISVYFAFDVMPDIPDSYLYSQYTGFFIRNLYIYINSKFTPKIWVGMHDEKLICNY